MFVSSHVYTILEEKTLVCLTIQGNLKIIKKTKKSQAISQCNKPWNNIFLLIEVNFNQIKRYSKSD